MFNLRVTYHGDSGLRDSVWQHPVSVLWKSLRSLSISSFLKIWKNSVLKPSGSERFMVGKHYIFLPFIYSFIHSFIHFTFRMQPPSPLSLPLHILLHILPSPSPLRRGPLGYQPTLAHQVTSGLGTSSPTKARQGSPVKETGSTGR